MDLREFIKEAFRETVENMQATEMTYEKYFSKDYIQHVDGKTLYYDDFVAHMKTQKKILDRAKVTFKHLLLEGDKIASIHIVDAIKKDGGEIRAQVNAILEVKNGKITLCDELTYLIIGSKEDKDIGSK